ncbi:MAG: GNAT family N-acetyltransferase, partial [Chloroflexota bacterium]|nr:GNAT family N-acetyltransferase [Chloroflexota bacterium]
MNYTILQIDHTSKYFEQVIQLGEANKKTLGFFPRGAFEYHAIKKQIIVAVDDESDTLLGYLLYGLSRRKMLASIVHLCIDENQRGRGITRALFSELKEQTKQGYKAIRVHCRTDYDANSLWPKLGFQAIREIPGRSKDGTTTLRVWMFDYGHPTLFSYAKNQSSKVKVAIDANVFFQLQHPQVEGHEESLTLLEPWLDIDLYLTPE